MFAAEIYRKRRIGLKKLMKEGVLLFLGNEESPMNYPANPFHFRQDSTFLYYWGLDEPGLAAVIDLDNDREIIFGYDFTIDDIIWMGPQPTLKQRAGKAGVKNSSPTGELNEYLLDVMRKDRKVHYLPQYRSDSLVKIENLLGIHPRFVNNHVSVPFIKAVVRQRAIKSSEEVKDIEVALEIAREMHIYAMKYTEPGKTEREIAGAVEGIALSRGWGLSFPIIFSIHGETLHNHYHGNIMKKGQIAVNDSGAESLNHYASDITRTIPVSGKFTAQQTEIYEIVLKAQLSAIDAMKPGKKFLDVHLLACKIIAQGLIDMGIMKGNASEAVKQGAHALFMPHGLGHMMGLDVHDMENLGEQYVGYDEKTKRSDQFGLAYLRMARELEQGHVMTVEPGIYFIPELIDLWESEKKHSAFIDYHKVKSFRNLGGIRIEDNVLITRDDHRVLGKPIPKSIPEVEAACS
ncbi:MAG: aminopeptidase P family protein [Calditrichaeota bacterium]|nr:aminopeptidase P family protein [Calditrichota bacterium]RQW06500.1 MAG: aminopeptidase P family protein [Calditrichota bacterium]